MKSPRTIEAMSQIGSAVAAQPIEWREVESKPGELTASGTIPSEFGHFKMISMNARITPQANHFICYCRAVCLPLSSEQTEESQSLGEAKVAVERMWRTQAMSLAMMSAIAPTSDDMPT